VNKSQLTDELRKSRPARHRSIAGKRSKPPEILKNSRPANRRLGQHLHHHWKRNQPIYNFPFLADDSRLLEKQSKSPEKFDE